MAGDIGQRAADYWPQMTRITCICSPCRAAEKRAKPARRRPRSPRSFDPLRCEQGCDSTAASSATVNCTALRTPSCASFDRTRESIMAEWAELRRELDDTRAALCRLRELHARARNEREEIAHLR